MKPCGQALWIEGHRPWLLEHGLFVSFKEVAGFYFVFQLTQKHVKYVGMTNFRFISGSREAVS